MNKTLAEMIEGVKHVGYEVWMTAEAAARLGRHVADVVVGNALTESMLLHIRSLIDFFVFTSKSPNRTDILRSQFTPKWNPAPAAEAARVLAGRETLHKHLAHLTWDRVDDGKQAYALAAAQDMIRIADDWGAHLAKHEPALHKEFEPYLVKAHAALAPRPPYTVVRTVTTTSG